MCSEKIVDLLEFLGLVLKPLRKNEGRKVRTTDLGIGT